jgi:hypothetical protein
MDLQDKEMRGIRLGRFGGERRAGYPVRMPGFSSPSRNQATPASPIRLRFDYRSRRGAVELTNNQLRLLY